MLAQLIEQTQMLDQGAAGSFMTDFERTLIILHAPLKQLFPKNTIKQVTLVGLRPSQQIVGHRDEPIEPAVRYHIPLVTNKYCYVFHGGRWQHLKTGWVYAMDPTIFHGAVNWGETLRLHLMVDVLA